MTDEAAEKFTGNPLLISKGIAFYEALVFIVLLAIVSQNMNGIGLAAGLVFLLLFYRIVGSQAYYFIISGNSLLIKNSLIPWYEKSYSLPSIKDIKLENMARRSMPCR